MSVTPKTLHLVEPRRAQKAAPLFDKIAIIGLRRVGASLAMAARGTWPSALVIGVDESDVLEQAIVRHAVDVGSSDLGIVGDAGLIVLARSVGENIAVLSELARCVEGAAVVTDVGSTKSAIVEEARRLPPRLTFVGGHPVVEPSEGGIESARPDLFDDRHWVFTPVDENPGPAFEQLWAVAIGVGAIPSSMKAADHDRLFAWLAHVPALLAAAVIEEAGRAIGAAGLAYAGADFAALMGFAFDSREAWRDVCATNREATCIAIDALIEQLRVIRERLAAGSGLDALVESATSWRQKLPPA